jgi:hypothetical protein
MKALKAELLAIHPEATGAALGTHRVWRFRVQTPAHTFESVVKPIDGFGGEVDHAVLIKVCHRRSKPES